jgi:hypothetical protein
MKSDAKSVHAPPKCDLCEKKAKTVLKIYNNHIRLCEACFIQMEKFPAILASSMERFLIGNVV